MAGFSPGTGEKITSIEYGDGIRVFLENRPYPHLGLPTEGAVAAIAVIKKLLYFWPRLKFEEIRAIGELILEPHMLKPEYMCPFAREIHRILPDRLKFLAYILEFDNSYRLRLQDLLHETTKEKLLKSPIKEVWRLLAINKRRDYAEVHKKFRYFAYLFTACLLLPTTRREFKACLLRSDPDKLRLSLIDSYWLEQRKDYKYDA